jgi:predicted dehydrogenase
MDRRDLLKSSALGAGVMVLPSYVVGKSPTKKSPSERLNIAMVGVAGRAVGNAMDLADENVVALCDVDRGKVQQEIAWSQKQGKPYGDLIKHWEKRGAKWFTDYRDMLSRMGDKIDAVVVTTPDHMHFPVSMSAINMGMHVYCEKPLTHTVEEARLLTQAAKKMGVVTQMGNQGHSNAGTRSVYEWLESGVIGPVKEVHSWTDRPAVFWPQGIDKPSPDKVPPIPKGLDFDLWLGVAEKRDYDPAYLPFKWRAFVDFGCGALGDMACHIMDSAFWGLKLGSPTHIEAITSPMKGYSYPSSSIVTYQFPKRDEMPALTYKWYDGYMYPALPGFLRNYPSLQSGHNTNGTLIVGEGAAILTDTYSGSVRIIPDERFAELKSSLPPKYLPRIKGSHMNNWLEAIREGTEATSDFSYAGPFTETVLLGCIAQRTGRQLAFDGQSGQFVNDDQANRMLTKDYPKGWILR